METQISPEEQADIESLALLFSDLDLITIQQVYLLSDKDVRTAREHLATVAKDPNYLLQLLANNSSSTQQARPHQSNASGGGLNTAAITAAATSAGFSLPAMDNSPQDEDPGASYFPNLTESTWDMSLNVISDTLANVGTTAADGIATLAASITDWVADLASAFDAGWGDEDEQQDVGQPEVDTRQQDLAGVGVGGSLDSERVYNRRQHPQTSAGGLLTGPAAAAAAAEEEEEELVEDDDDEVFKKDA